MDSLLLNGANVVASHHLLCLLEVLSSFSWCFWASLAEVVPVFSAEVASTMAGLVSWDYSSEALGSGLHGSVNERKFGDVVLVDHTKDGLLLADVHFRLLNFLLIGRLELPLYWLRT